MTNGALHRDRQSGNNDEWRSDIVASDTAIIINTFRLGQKETGYTLIFRGYWYYLSIAMYFWYRMFLTPGTQTDICSYKDAGISCNFPSACSASRPETVSVLSSPSTQGVYSSQGTQGSDVSYKPGDSEEIEHEHERLVDIVCTALPRSVFISKIEDTA